MLEETRKSGKKRKLDQDASVQVKERPKRQMKKRIDNLEPESATDDSFLDKDFSYASTSDSDDDDSGNGSIFDPPEKQTGANRCQSDRKMLGTGIKKTVWSKTEIEALQKGFQRNLLEKTCPKKFEVSRVCDMFPFLKSRTPHMIKCKVQHLIKTADKLSTALLQR